MISHGAVSQFRDRFRGQVLAPGDGAHNVLKVYNALILGGGARIPGSVHRENSFDVNQNVRSAGVQPDSNKEHNHE